MGRPLRAGSASPPRAMLDLRFGGALHHSRGASLMPAVRVRTRFHKEFAVLMRIWDQVAEPERQMIQASVDQVFSEWSDATDIARARAYIANIAAKYGEAV